MSTAAITFFCLALGAAAASDLASYRIPNIIPFALAVGAVVLACPATGAELVARSEAVAIVSAGALGAYLLGGLGGGDVKLLAAISFWTPLATLPQFLLPLAIAGGVQAIATLAIRRLTFAPSGVGARPIHMPYAVSIAAAGAAWVFS